MRHVCDYNVEYFPFWREGAQGLTISLVFDAKTRNKTKIISDIEDYQGWKDAEVRSCPSRIAGQPWDERELGRKRWEVSAV